MHPNPIFRKSECEANVEFVRHRSFSNLSINAEDGPLVSHVPFHLSEDGKSLEAHLVRSNPIVRALKTGETKAVISVNGGDGYISPDWYEIEDQVPTWNYVAVHLRGGVRLLPNDALRGVLGRLSAAMEKRLLPKSIWTMDKMTPEALAKMMRQIAPIAMDVSDIDGTWKLSQNKPDDVRVRAHQGLASTGFGLEYQTIAELMKDPPC